MPKLDPSQIRRVPRFADISEAALGWLCARAAVRDFGKGEAIFFEGDDCAHFYMVLQGEVKIFKVLESGREMILSFFRAGEAIGEVSIMDGGELPANAVAQEPCSLLVLPRKEYLLFLEKFPEVARSIIRDLTLRMRALRVRVETLSESGVQSRIAQLLQSFGRELGRETEEGFLVPVRLSRGDIASMVGARIETVIRIMSRWQKEDVVRTEPEGFLVPVPEALEALIAREG